MERLARPGPAALDRFEPAPRTGPHESVAGEIEASLTTFRLIGLAQCGDKTKKLSRYEPDPMATRETLELVRAYYKIEDAEIRKRLRELTKALGVATSKDS